MLPAWRLDPEATAAGSEQQPTHSAAAACARVTGCGAGVGGDGAAADASAAFAAPQQPAGTAARCSAQHVAHVPHAHAQQPAPRGQPVGPATAADFMRAWRRDCPGPEQRWAYLWALGPAQLPSFFRVELSSELLAQVATVLASGWRRAQHAAGAAVLVRLRGACLPLACACDQCRARMSCSGRRSGRDQAAGCARPCPLQAAPPTTLKDNQASAVTPTRLQPSLWTS